MRYPVSVPLLLLTLVMVAGCQWFSTPAHTDAQGVKHPAKQGVVDKAAEAAKAAGAAGVPFAGIAGGVIGIVGAVGAWFKNRENKRNLKGFVGLIEKIKPRVEALTNRKDLKDLIVNATEGTKFGAALKKTHAALKKI